MVDHLARAEEMRARARNCELAAERSSSAKFAACFRLLVKNYDTLATVEEEYQARAEFRAKEIAATRW